MYIQSERENSFDMPCLFCLFAYLHIYMAHEHYELYEREGGTHTAAKLEGLRLSNMFKHATNE